MVPNPFSPYGDLATLVTQLNTWGGQVDSALAELRGSILLIVARIGNITSVVVTVLTMVIETFKGELHRRSASLCMKTPSYARTCKHWWPS